MENTNKEKNRFRRYLDNIYTRDEALQLISDIRLTDNKDLLNELSEEIWEESSSQYTTSDLERERYKKEARLLLRKIEHGKRLFFRRISYAVAGVAALFCIALGIRYFYQTNVQDAVIVQATTSFGEKKQITLPDGTCIVLNSCSSLRYPDVFAGEMRKVELDGEAYFRVARNEAMPFIITTKNFDVRVLGTHFNVKSYSKDEIVSVNVESGKVQIDLPEAMMRLTASEQVFINTLSGEYTKKREGGEVAAWIKGTLKFNSTPIRDVARELERVYNCHIAFANEYEFNNLISGEHDNESLESVLKSIKYISGVKYKKEGRNIVFFK